MQKILRVCNLRVTEGDHETSFSPIAVDPSSDRSANTTVLQSVRALSSPQAGRFDFNGGDAGEIALVLCGLGVFSFPDKHLKNHYLSLIPPGSLMGDVDGLTHESVNVYDSAFRDSEVRLIKRDIFGLPYPKPGAFACAYAVGDCASRILHGSINRQLDLNASRSPSGSLRKSGGFFRKIHREKKFCQYSVDTDRC